MIVRGLLIAALLLGTVTPSWAQSPLVAELESFATRYHEDPPKLDRLREGLTQAAKAVRALDLRLYVHNSNARAIHAYRRCDFTVAPYTIMTRPLGSSSQPKRHPVGRQEEIRDDK